MFFITWIILFMLSSCTQAELPVAAKLKLSKKAVEAKITGKGKVTMINGKKKGGPQQQNQLKNSQKRQTVIVKNNKSVQDLKLKMEKTNQKKKSLKNVSNKASKPKSKTTLEKQIALNKHQTGLKKIKNMNYLQSYKITKTNYAPKSNDGVCDKKDYRVHRRLVRSVLMECTQALILLTETNFVRYELQKKNLESCVRDLTGAISAFEIC